MNPFKSTNRSWNFIAFRLFMCNDQARFNLGIGTKNYLFSNTHTSRNPCQACVYGQSKIFAGISLNQIFAIKKN